MKYLKGFIWLEFLALMVTMLLLKVTGGMELFWLIFLFISSLIAVSTFISYLVMEKIK
jgi:hypothetical protein